MVIKGVRCVQSAGMLNLIGPKGMVHGVNVNPLVKAYLPGDLVDILHVFGNCLFHLLPSLTNSKLTGSPFLVFLFCLLLWLMAQTKSEDLSVGIKGF